MDTTPDAVWRHRLRVLSEQYELPASAPGRLGVLLERLAADDRAPTTVRDPEEAVDAHVADSLVALGLNEITAAGSIVDLGAGAGFPSLVLAAALPQTRVVAVESVGKKAAFISETGQAMGLTNLEVVPLRAEEWSSAMGEVDVVTARALAPTAILVEYAAPILRLGGSLVAWKGRRDPQEDEAGAVAADLVGLGVGAVHPVTPFAGARDRHLHVFEKIASTPNRYPRRPGMARKRPLAG